MARAARQSGVTLVELVIVAAVIGVLVATAIPALQRARRNAVEAGVIGDLKEMARMQELFFVNPEVLAPSATATDKRYARIDELNAFARNAFGTPVSSYSIAKGVVRYEMLPLAPSLLSLASGYKIEARGTGDYAFIYAIDESGLVVKIK